MLKTDSGRLSFRDQEKNSKHSSSAIKFRSNQNAIITTELVARADFFHHLPWSTKRKQFVKEKQWETFSVKQTAQQAWWEREEKTTVHCPFTTLLLTLLAVPAENTMAIIRVEEVYSYSYPPVCSFSYFHKLQQCSGYLIGFWLSRQTSLDLSEKWGFPPIWRNLHLSPFWTESQISTPNSFFSYKYDFCFWPQNESTATPHPPILVLWGKLVEYKNTVY